MTEYSWPWSTVAALGDGATTLSEALSREFLATYFGVQDPAVEGVSKGVMNELAVSGTASPVSVATGSGICYGLYRNTGVVTLAVTTPAVGTTGFRVVMQTNWAGTGGAGLEARTRLAIRKSADGVAAIPALVQAFGTTWEISLATGTITTGGVIALTDARNFRKSTAVVGTSELVALAVTTAKIALLNITTALLADLAVTTGKIADLAVTSAKLGALSVIAGKIADGAVDTAARLASNVVTTVKILDANVTTAKLALLSVTTSVINDLAVTSGKIAANAVIAGKLADGAVETAARIVDGIISTAKLANLAVTTAKLALNSVDDTIAGDRVPQFYRRQGGDAADWSITGTITRTPAAVRMQAGVGTTAGGVALAVTFPVAFSNKPLLFITNKSGNLVMSPLISVWSATGFTLIFYDEDHIVQNCQFDWLAIGPE